MCLALNPPLRPSCHHLGLRTQGQGIRRQTLPVVSRVVLRASLCFLCLSRPLPADVDVIAKFAQLEFQLGDAERARAIFESTLSAYPKRTDVWSVYIDMIIKHGSQKEAR